MNALVAAMTEPEARQITERIRAALDRVSTAWSELGERITEAYQRRADLALGYGSWAEYAEAELRPSEGLAAEVRRQLVGMLSQAGMSTRAIAPTVGVQHSAVAKDLRRSGVSDGHTSTRDHLNTETGELVPETLDEFQRRVLHDAERTGTRVPLTGPGSVATPHVTGLDGKSYPKATLAEQAKPKRKSWPDALNAAVWALTKVATTLTNLASDDRATKYKGEASSDARNLAHAIDALQRVHDQIA